MAMRRFRRARGVQQQRGVQQAAAAARHRYGQLVRSGRVRAVTPVTYVKAKGGR